MERTYIALVEKDTTSDYGVFFPDLLGCITAGTTFEEAREMAREVLALQLEGMAADGEYIPPPGSADDALAYEDAHYAIALIVVEALPERTEEEAQAELDAFLASDEYRELYGKPLTEDDLDDSAYYGDSYETEAVRNGAGLRPVIGPDTGRTYAALVRQDAAGNFNVGFPDLPGCIAVGNTLEEACKTAREALSLHLASMSADGHEAPPPSCASDVLAHPDAADAVALTVVTALSERESATEAYREIYGDPVSAS